MMKGDYNVRCDISGFVVKASQCKKMWNGWFVRKDLWTPRHPLDHVPPVKDAQRPSHPRPEGEDQFIEAGDVTAADL